MPTITEVRTAFRALIAARPALAPEVIALFAPIAEPQDLPDTRREALAYVLTTPPEQMQHDRWNASWSVLIPLLPQPNGDGTFTTALPETGAGSVVALRDRLRALLVHASSPQWLRDQCERLKRSRYVGRRGAGLFQLDQQETDPIHVAATAAVAAVPLATEMESVRQHWATLAQFRDLTPS